MVQWYEMLRVSKRCFFACLFSHNFWGLVFPAAGPDLRHFQMLATRCPGDGPVWRLLGLFGLSFDRQVCLFSATMAPEILDMTSKFMRNAVRILVKKDVNQLYVLRANLLLL